MKIQYDQPLRYLKPLKPEHFTDVEQVDWFSHCGKEVAFSAKPQLESIKSLAKAVAACDWMAWENFRLDKQHELTSFLSRTKPNEANEWNTMTGGIKKYLEHGIFPTIRERLRQRNLPESIFASVAWDILSYYQEIAYKKYNIPTFYAHLLPIYQNGHLPCGYRGASPNGAVLIY